MTNSWNKFHDAGIVDIQLGMRREVRLQLDVLHGDRGPLLQKSAASIRFGAIENYGAVADFFRKLERSSIPDAYIDVIDSIAVAPVGWIVTLQNAGSVWVESQKPPNITWEEVG
jgi:hypothetical protein